MLTALTLFGMHLYHKRQLLSYVTHGAGGLSPYMGPALSHLFQLSLQTSQAPDDWHRTILTPSRKSIQCNRLEPILAHLSCVCCLQIVWSYPKNEVAWPLAPTRFVGPTTGWFIPPLLNSDQCPRGRRIGHKMAQPRKCSRPDLSRLLWSLWFGQPSAHSSLTQRMWLRPYRNKLGWIFSQSTNLPSKRQWSPISNDWGHKLHPRYGVCHRFM